MAAVTRLTDLASHLFKSEQVCNVREGAIEPNIDQLVSANLGGKRDSVGVLLKHWVGVNACLVGDIKFALIGTIACGQQRIRIVVPATVPDGNRLEQVPIIVYGQDQRM